jgi:hypothetical protein
LSVSEYASDELCDRQSETDTQEMHQSVDERFMPFHQQLAHGAIPGRFAVETFSEQFENSEEISAMLHWRDRNALVVQ